MIRKGQQVRVVLVGTGPMEAELRRYAKNSGLPATFAGFVNQRRLADFYASADLLVLPSASETWGLVVNEAFACGLPAIVSDRVGCAPDMIRNATGRVFPVGDAERLADIIEQFDGRMHDPSVSSALAEMTDRYSPTRSVEALIEAAEESRRHLNAHTSIVAIP
jgi:glycosyltransferase involved in cell wall biosynthesis